MSAEGRPRRTARATVRVPIQLTQGDSTTKSRIGSTSDEVSAEQGLGGVGKRKIQHSVEDGMDASKSEAGLEEQNDPTTKTGAKGERKDRRAKLKSILAEKTLYDIDFILTSPKSPLVNLDISDVLNYGAWASLSPEARLRLCRLLPATAFGERYRAVGEFHPSRRREQGETFATQPNILNRDDDSMKVGGPSMPRSNKDQSTVVEEPSLDPSFFRDPHFESAAGTFQDHLYSGWFTRGHQELVDKHLSGIHDASLHAPWKDDVWDRDHPQDGTANTLDAENGASDPSDSIGVRSQKRKGKESEFSPFIQKAFLKQGDIISLKHKFINQGITIEKDALIIAIHPKSGALTLAASSGSVPSLPASLLTPVPTDPSDPSSLREMTVSTPAQLLTALIDIDGRIQRAERPRLDTWKILTVWQWAPETEIQGISSDEAALLERGGRVCLGTLFYLRGQALDD